MFKLNVEKKRLIENFFSLSFLQIINYILPLITIPYLVRVLGPEKFGLIAFAHALIQFFIMFTDYGFNFSATRKISILRDDSDAISRIFSSVVAIKIIMSFVSFFVLVGLVFSIPKFRPDWIVYIFTFGILIGQVLFPLWFFQGIEQMKYITFINILGKFIFTVAIFIFIKSSSDYVFVPLINASGFIVSGVLGIFTACKVFGIKLKIPLSADLIREVKEGWHLFISSVSISLYTSSNTVILGLLTNNTIVGYYSAAERLIKAVQNLLEPISQSVYPYISNLVSKSKESAMQFLKKISSLLKVGVLVLSIFIFIFSKPIVAIVLGRQYYESVVVLRIMSILPFLIGAATCYARFFLLGFGYYRELSKIVISSAILNLFFAFLFIYILGLAHTGAALGWVTTECCVLFFSYIAYRRLALCQ